jgi:hypothetical protein
MSKIEASRMSETQARTTAQHTETPLTVVLVAADCFETIKRTLSAVATQTIAGQLEVLLVAPDAEALAELRPQDVAAFGRFDAIYVGPIVDVDKAAAPGLVRASSPVVALVEDHAYPEPGWAEAILRAHEGVWAAVGSTVVNANPDGDLSWINQLLAYGEWTEPQCGGEGAVSRHNVSFKRSWLKACGGSIEDLLGRSGGLLTELKRRGARFWVEPEARVRHVNPSRFRPTVALRLHGARLSAAGRASSEGWPWWRRAAYAGASPLIPLVRLKRLLPKVFGAQLRGRAPRLLPLLVGALVLDGVGQALGFALGPGRAAREMAAFEFRRDRHLTDDDRRKLSLIAG